MARFKGNDGQGADVIQWNGNREATERWLSGLGVDPKDVNFAWSEEGEMQNLTFNEAPEGREDGLAQRGDFIVAKEELVGDPTDENPSGDWKRRVYLVPRDRFMAEYTVETPTRPF